MGRTDYLYLLVDVSKSMEGRKIGAVNDSINGIVYRLRKIAIRNNVTIRIILMTFDSSVRWSNIVPIDINKFSFTDLIITEEMPGDCFGAAMKELLEKIEKQAEVTEDNSRTTMVLFTDGLFTESYSEKLANLLKNQLFKKANRIAFTFEDSLSLDIAKKNLVEFTGCSDFLIVEDFNKLNQLLFENYK